MARRRNAVDQTTARELQLYIENDGTLYRQKTWPIIVNVARKIKRGVYDHSKAPRLWLYLVDAGAKKYEKDHMTPGTWHTVFPKPLRERVARTMADEHYDAFKDGEYDGSFEKERGLKGFAFKGGRRSNPRGDIRLSYERTGRMKSDYAVYDRGAHIGFVFKRSTGHWSYYGVDEQKLGRARTRGEAGAVLARRQ